MTHIGTLSGFYRELLTLSAAFVLATIHLVERRQRAAPLHPGRQVALSTLLESMPEAVLVFGTDQHLQQSNRAAQELLGIPPDEIVDLKAINLRNYVIDQTTGAPPEVEQMAIMRALKGESVHQQRRTLTLPRATVEALVSANPIREADGTIVGVLVVVRDVTELAELRQHQDETERTGAIGSMAASLAHDFNNVLDTISKAAYVLEVTPDRPEQERLIVLHMIQNACKRGSEIVSNVRQYLSGQGTSTETIDLNRVLEEAIELTRPILQSSGRTISLEREFQPVSPVRANPAEMRRVFTNLIINAVEAMPRGGVLRVGCEQAEQNVRVFVEDSGEGISPEMATKIFRPYNTTKKQGTGLGLSSSRRFVQSQGGRIWFKTEVGRGTRFVVEMPAAGQKQIA